MKKGCLVLLAVWAVVGVLDYFLLAQQGKAVPSYVAVLLGLSATIVVANIHGLRLGWVRWLATRRAPSEWKDGVLLGISGRLSVLKGPLTAPGSGKSVVLYETEICQRQSSGDSTHEQILTSSFGMAPCGIATRQGVIRLTGFPLLTHVPAQRFEDEKDLDRAAQFIAATKWTRSETSIPKALAELNAVLSDADGEVKADFNRKLQLLDDEGLLAAADENEESEPSGENSEELPEDDGPSITTEEGAIQYYRSLLSDDKTFIKEHSIENGAEVSAFGTYSANPPRLNIGSAFTNLSHGLYLGPIKSVLKRQALGSLAAVCFWGLVCVGSHAYCFLGFDGIKHLLAIENSSPR